MRYDERLTGKPYRYAYALCIPAGADNTIGAIGRSEILKHDLIANTRQIHDFGPNRFPGEFVFIPKTETAAEDEGWLIGLVVNQNDETTDLVVLNASDFTAPPQATIHLPHRIPPGFHGNWIAAV